jgi:FkbM family methyltransferase
MLAGLVERAIFSPDVENELKEKFFSGTPRGFFVEVGANDPEHMSQTWHLERLGWRGVLVEPQPALAHKLRERRRAAVFACACSSPERAGKTFPFQLSGIHSSLNPNFFVAGARKEEVIEVPVRTLDDILEEAKAPVPIDFLSIDVESHEIEVLAGLTLSRWRPRLILIEDPALGLRLHRLLRSHGYKWLRRTGINSWYVPADSAAAVSAFGRWQFVRKHYLGVPLRVVRERKRQWREQLGVSGRAALRRADLISVIVTTYDREDALEAVLRALARQSDRNFEIIVADDGSGPATARVIDAAASRLPVAIKHVRQAHDGFRGAEIRNRGVRASQGTYCVFLDGDCLPRLDFVAVHRALAEHGWFVTGNRILLSRRLTEAALGTKLAIETWGFARLLAERCGGGVNRLLPALRLPVGPLRRLQRRDWRGAQTCNLAVWRSDLDRVDGFDSSYNGWGLEDSDLVVRLLHAGVERKDGRFATGVLHLWHPANDRSQFGANQARLDATMREGRVRARRGLSLLVDGPDRLSVNAGRGV